MRNIDIYAIGKALGYTEGQTRSIESIEISGRLHEVKVTRFVQEPNTQEPQKAYLRPGEPVEDVTDEEYERFGSPLTSVLVDERFRYTPWEKVPGEIREAPEYVRLSRGAVQLLRRQQGA